MREFILGRIREIAHQNHGVSPGVAAFAAATGITQGKWRGVYWARWADALIEAGLVPNKLTERLDTQAVLSEVAALARTLGKMPSYSDVRLSKRTNAALPSDKTLSNHFGDAEGLRAALRDYAKAQKDEALLVLLPVAGSSANVPSLHHPKDGFVYLLKSGTFYKIGRSKNMARRISEIKVTLPEAVELIHAIKTDDPSGIECYWHRRFESRRRNGEWFALDAADIRVFLRRSFQ